jgi:beta-glucanase (GH16 family)
MFLAFCSSSIQWYYDGTLVGQVTTNITSSSMYLILDNEMGQWGGPTLPPADIEVDYVHVYSQNGTAVTPESNYGGPGDTDGSTTGTDTQPPTALTLRQTRSPLLPSLFRGGQRPAMWEW